MIIGVTAVSFQSCSRGLNIYVSTILQYGAKLADEEKEERKKKIAITTINITTADCDRLYKLFCCTFRY